MDIGHRLKAVRTKGGPLPARAGKTLRCDQRLYLPDREKSGEPLGGLPAQGAGRHPHVIGQLLHRRDGDGFRGDLPCGRHAGSRHPPHQLPSGGSQPRQPRHRHDAGDTAPGADTGDDMLSHEGEECGIVIRGQVEVTVGEQVHLLAPGMATTSTAALPTVFATWGSGVRADLRQHARQLLTGLLPEQPAGIPCPAQGSGQRHGLPPAARPRHHRPGPRFDPPLARVVRGQCLMNCYKMDLQAAGCLAY